MDKPIAEKVFYKYDMKDRMLFIRIPDSEAERGDKFLLKIWCDGKLVSQRVKKIFYMDRKGKRYYYVRFRIPWYSSILVSGVKKQKRYLLKAEVYRL